MAKPNSQGKTTATLNAPAPVRTENGADRGEDGTSVLARFFGIDVTDAGEISFEQAQSALLIMARNSGLAIAEQPAGDAPFVTGSANSGSAPSTDAYLSSLHAAELRYRALVDNIPAVTFVAALDGDHQDLFISPQIQSLLGFTQEQWLSEPFLWYYRVHPDDRERWAQAFAQTCSAGIPFKSEYRMLASDDRVVWIHGECQLIRDMQGFPRFLQGIAFDITENKRAEEVLRRSHDELDTRVRQRTHELAESNQALRSEIVGHEKTHRRMDHQYRELQRTGDALRESEGRLRAILEAAVEGIITIDEQGSILSFNAAAGRIFGYSLEEILGKNVAMLMPVEYSEKHDGYLENYRVTRIRKIIGIDREVTGLRKNGQTFPVDLSVSETVLDDRRIFTGIVRDISERKRIEQELRQSKDAAVHAALHDKLTGLPNRALLHDRLNVAIQRHRRRPTYCFALLFLDFDRFKMINDSLGHEVGDDLLIEISSRLANTVRVTDSIGLPDRSTVARMGGDEFVILADDLRDVRDAAVVADRLLTALSAPYDLRGHSITSTVSVGITTSEVGYERADDMLRDADIAMYHAKAAGKARYAIFDRRMHEEVVFRVAMESDLRNAVERGELELHYQPILSLGDKSLHGFEALVRWQHPKRGMVSPADFIPCCEDTGMIIPIGYWVLGEACRQLKEWQNRHPVADSMAVSVNLSAKQLIAPKLVSKIGEIIAASGVTPGSIILEITESTMIKNMEVAIPVLEQLRALGVRLHMDDFGTGYSSLSCLHRFPLTGLKIDRSFVKSMTERRDYAAIVHAIITLAHNLGITLVAEGIETPDQVVMLQAMECDAGQGYLFSRPVPAAAAETFFKPST